MRVAFTIIYNAVHHLQHKDYLKSLAPHVDYWVFVDGLAMNGGSTSWCNNLDEGCSSSDVTVEYIREIRENHPNIILLECKRKWASKDVMVNRAIELLKMKTRKAFLWQIDADEQWTPEIMTLAEKTLVEKRAKVGTFHSNYFITDKYIASGLWGEGLGYPYKRLWNWEGEYFLKHEPPTLRARRLKEALLPYRFDHYAYYFEQDVIFKSKYYKGHEKIHDSWLALCDGKIKVPCEVKELFGHSNGFFHSTQIRAI